MDNGMVQPGSKGSHEPMHPRSLRSYPDGKDPRDKDRDGLCSFSENPNQK